MTAETGYTEKELITLATAVTTSSLAVAMADLGIISTAIEAAALAREVAGAAQKYPNNGVIQALFGDHVATDHLQAQHRIDNVAPEDAVEVAIGQIHRALDILNQKASPHEIQEYKELVYTCADRVAHAARSGLLGLIGPKVSPKEAATLSMLKSELKL
jgi:hypothetical protein